MNPRNIRKAIAVMQRAIDRGGKFSMANWQSRQTRDGLVQAVGAECAFTESQLHACGNAACFAGYLDISPEWRADFGRVQARNPHLAEWLGIPTKAVSLIIHNYTPSKWNSHILYMKPWLQVTPQDVIDVLNRVLVEGPDFLISRYTEFHTLP